MGSNQTPKDQPSEAMQAALRRARDDAANRLRQGIEKHKRETGR